MKKLILAAVLTVATGAAQAATLTFGPHSGNGTGHNATFNLVTPTALVGDAVLTFSVRDDLDWRTEFIDVSIEGFSLGRVFDNRRNNDAFNFRNDVGTQYRRLHTGSATISNADFAPLIADGTLSLLFDFSNRVHQLRGRGRQLFGSITFTEVAAVPLPASLGLLGFGLAGLGALRARRKSKTTAAA